MKESEVNLGEIDIFFHLKRREAVPRRPLSGRFR